ncbi:hypothetical protein HBA55_36095 [Pseudomaricurvus alkylphenolicus]|uniref:hypothetical protein n=1 Tax=Pseudomaricurvus alkylphenolicus TaxID=1306991 RepID=UPI00142072EC|nr:hypothetical protein [Pseudomaricurvus alkylphenolicus]NIB45056.1 hypothetical protein [Pseudomaricurvus alkylphenolicus]
MNKAILFSALKEQGKTNLIEILCCCFDEMSTHQRRTVFGTLYDKTDMPILVSESVLEDVLEFCKESFEGVYYAPFEINSRNCTHIPEETEEWFEKLNDLLQLGFQLTKQEEHHSAVSVFDMLYKLIDRMETGEEIVFSDEYGSWMIPGDERRYLEAYIISLACVSTPQEYARKAADLVERDSFGSFRNKVYSAALKYANEEQIEALNQEVKTKNIRTNRIGNSGSPNSG